MEDDAFRSESISYAVNLAKRMDCSISVLMLAENSESKNGHREGKEETIELILTLIKAEGVAVQGISRHGDKASGLLKHLASYPSFEAIIWGGIEKISSKHQKKNSDHWLAKIQSTIRCPIVSPTKKYQDQRET